MTSQLSELPPSYDPFDYNGHDFSLFIAVAFVIDFTLIELFITKVFRFRPVSYMQEVQHYILSLKNILSVVCWYFQRDTIFFVYFLRKSIPKYWNS